MYTKQMKYWLTIGLRGAAGSGHGMGCTWWDAPQAGTAPNAPQCFCQCSQSKPKVTDNKKVAGEAGVTRSSGKRWAAI